MDRSNRHEVVRTGNCACNSQKCQINLRKCCIEFTPLGNNTSPTSGTWLLFADAKEAGESRYKSVLVRPSGNKQKNQAFHNDP